ncbi:hypothetical protein [Candidatus Binatus sp.]|uniref:hypothetical protein n=1 Tax=Candidatus Binatus sp. TaxID=2811406 RepID=UPI002F921AED
MLRDLGKYLRAVGMKWLSSYSFVTAIPEVARLFSPNWYSKATNFIAPYAGYAQVAVLSLGIFGLFFAGFLTWREEYVRNKSPLYARIRQTRCSPSNVANFSTIRFDVDLRNGGPPTVATDWLFYIGKRKLARASERTFFLDNESPIDPQKTPLPQGASAYGTLVFTVKMSVPEAESARKEWRLICQDAARREVVADDVEADGL